MTQNDLQILFDKAQANESLEEEVLVEFSVGELEKNLKNSGDFIKGISQLGSSIWP